MAGLEKEVESMLLRGSKREFLCGGGTVLYLDRDGGYRILYT